MPIKVLKKKKNYADVFIFKLKLQVLEVISLAEWSVQNLWQNYAVVLKENILTYKT